MFFPLNKPPQWLLDAMLKAETGDGERPCPDCGAGPKENHHEGCDVARCLGCGGQRLSCGCSGGSGDVWTGLWPGVKECYEKGYVCYDTASGTIGFDLNRQARDRVGAKPVSDLEYAKAQIRHSSGPLTLGGFGWK